MKTIGQYLKRARALSGKNLKDIEKSTKIKQEFISAIEREDWNKLPEYPVVVGFVKNLATHLKLNQTQAVALLRRDYPPKRLKISPKPDVGKRFKWGPKLTFIIGTTVVTLLIAVYVGLQYKSFLAKPKLEILKPAEGEIIRSRQYTITGKTNSDTIIRVNNQPAIVDSDGNWEAQIEIAKDLKEVEVKAISRSLKETVIIKQLIVELE